MNPQPATFDPWSLPPVRDDEEFPLLTEIVADAAPNAPTDPLQHLEKELRARLETLLEQQRAEAEDTLREWLEEARARLNTPQK